MDCGFWIVGMLSIAMLAIGCDRESKPSPMPTAQVVRGNGVIRGNVTFTGAAPTMQLIDTKSSCGPDAKPIAEETVIVNPNGTLRNVLVYLKGAPAGDGSAEAPVVMDQDNCRYVPHVIGVQVGQTLRFRSSDAGTLHNVHYNPERNPPANMAFTSGGATKDVTFKHGGEIIRAKCDVHPWMTGYVGVVENPWFAVTNDVGEFEIKGIPPGKYKLVAWQELFGTKEQDVTISDGSAVDVTVAYPSSQGNTKDK